MRTSRFTTRAVVIAAVLAGLQTGAAAGTFYIDPNGSNSNNGSKDNPWQTLKYAVDHIDPGDTVLVRGGLYVEPVRITFQSNEGGTAAMPINIWAYEENGVMETPIFDFSTNTATAGTTDARGFQINEGADWLHFKGLTIQKAGDNGLYNEGSNNTFERMVLWSNKDSGLQLDGTASNNLVLNSDSYENFDPQGNGEDADGFAAKWEELGPGNVFRGNRAWNNSDDGWDFWHAATDPNDTSGVLVEDSWSFDNGQDIWGVGAGFEGDGNGFKLGQLSGNHVLRNVLAVNNEHNGIDINGNLNFNGVQVYNATSYHNGEQNWLFDEALPFHVLRNNISFDGGDGDDIAFVIDDTFNTWNAIPVNAADFVSLDFGDGGMQLNAEVLKTPRQPDGSLPILDFLKLVPGSNLIDAGTDVGLPYNGAAPDLGAFETSSIFVPPGDADGDGDVDLDDYNIMSGNMNTNVAGGASDGDFDEDGDVDFEDFVIQALNFGDWPSAEETLNPIPEPVIAPPLLGLLVLYRRARPRSGGRAGD